MSKGTNPLLNKASNRIEGLLLKAFEEGTCFESNDHSRVQRLRPSSFPFCPVRFFLQLPNGLSKGKRISASMAYYVRVGHVIHDVFQEALSSVDDVALYFIRDWLCPACKHLHTLVPKPDACEKCGAKFRHRAIKANLEHTISEGNLVGHVDDAFVFEHKQQTYAIVIDYKSTSVARLHSKTFQPPKSYLHQLSSYAALLSKRIPVIGYALIFIPRDNPRRLKAFPYLLTDEERDLRLAEIKKYEKEHARALKIRTESQFGKLIQARPCRTMQDVVEKYESCPFSSFCTTGNDASLLSEGATVLRRLERIRG